MEVLGFMSIAEDPRRKVKGRRPPQGTPCGYCFNAWATVYDHLWPYSAGGDASDENLYPACKRCNLILNNRCFDTIDAKREYLRQVLLEKGEW
jgi:5-methylcytosine-specific restriction endonuclease McrA